jgi:hypothetical protein
MYVTTHTDAEIQYCASNMVLNVHSDALYLSAPDAQSHAGGYFFLGGTPCDGSPIQIIGAVHVTCTILKLMVASVAEVELGALFLNAQEAKVILKNLVIRNHQLSYTLTTPLLLALLTTPSNNNIHKLWK